jgi:hypothetical protein
VLYYAAIFPSVSQYRAINTVISCGDWAKCSKALPTSTCKCVNSGKYLRCVASFLTFFHKCSMGLQSGAYVGNGSTVRRSACPPPRDRMPLLSLASAPAGPPCRQPADRGDCSEDGEGRAAGRLQGASRVGSLVQTSAADGGERGTGADGGGRPGSNAMGLLPSAGLVQTSGPFRPRCTGRSWRGWTACIPPKRWRNWGRP